MKELLVKYVGVIWLIKHLYLIGVWLGADRRENIIKTHV